MKRVRWSIVTSNMIGIIVCVSMVVCGMGAYFIGRTQGIEWAITHIGEIRVTVEDEEDDKGGKDQKNG